MFLRGLILLNIAILLLSLCFLLVGGIFYCSTSYTGKLYGNISCAVALIFLIFIYILSITSRNDGMFPLKEILIFIPVIITILSVLLTSYNTKKHRKNILSNKANSNYYLYNGIYILTLSFTIIFQIINLIINYFYSFTNQKLKSVIYYAILFSSILNGTFSYLSHYYLNY